MGTVQIGSISTGTLRTADLLPAFAEELRSLDPDGASTLIAEYDALPDDWQDCDCCEDSAAFILDDVTDALVALAPPHVYFGSLEGDGADFGFWPSPEPIADTCSAV